MDSSFFPVTSHQCQASRRGHQESPRCSFRCPLALRATPMRRNDGLPVAVDQLDVVTILDGLNLLRDGSIGADAMLVHQLLGLREGDGNWGRPWVGLRLMNSLRSEFPPANVVVFYFRDMDLQEANVRGPAKVSIWKRPDICTPSAEFGVPIR